jgi:hypothetical protein
MATVTMPVGFVKAEFLGRNGSGPVSVPGVKAGDVVVMYSNDNHERTEIAFECTITTDDEVHQFYSGNWSGDTFVMVLLRGV